jgi:hypothetical protein
MLFSGASRASHVSDEAFGIESTMTDKLAKSETTSLRLPGDRPGRKLKTVCNSNPADWADPRKHAYRQS